MNGMEKVVSEGKRAAKGEAIFRYYVNGEDTIKKEIEDLDKKIAEAQKSENSIYYKEIKINDKKGYIDVKKQDDKYLVEFMYNYARIESLVNKEDINNVILNSSYILSTVKFNNNVIKILLDEDYFKYKEEKFELFDKVEKNENFLEYTE